MLAFLLPRFKNGAGMVFHFTFTLRPILFMRPLILFLIFLLSILPLDIQAQTVPEIKKSQLELPDDLTPYYYVRVSVYSEKEPVSIKSESGYKVLNEKGKLLSEGNQRLEENATLASGAVKIGNKVYPAGAVRLDNPGGTLYLGKREYRRSLIFLPSEGKLTVINELRLEDYLKGVLPWEANPEWHAEALKAQAVVSRTYALFRAIERRYDPYDLSSGVMSQVYKGRSIEKVSTNAAIEATRGEILTYRGKIFPAFFHSTCGGMTTRPEYNWNIQPHESMKGNICEFCRTSKHYRWEAEFTNKEILAALKKGGYSFTSLKGIEAYPLDESGRAKTFIFHVDGKTKEVNANEFRIWLDPARFKSTKLEDIETTPNGFKFKGFGWGHGVGLCQYGMKRLAELGYTYTEILNYYYPESEITSIGAAPDDSSLPLRGYVPS